jgi:hypothetical protein
MSFINKIYSVILIKLDFCRTIYHIYHYRGQIILYNELNNIVSVIDSVNFFSL